MEHIYRSMHAKAHSNIKMSQVTQQNYYNMRTFNKSMLLGDKVLKKNMADYPHKAKMK